MMYNVLLLLFWIGGTIKKTGRKKFCDVATKLKFKPNLQDSILRSDTQNYLMCEIFDSFVVWLEQHKLINEATE